MYKDIITEEKIPGIYILMNNRIVQSYNMIFDDVINLITFNLFALVAIKSTLTFSSFYFE